MGLGCGQSRKISNTNKAQPGIWGLAAAILPDSRARSGGEYAFWGTHDNAIGYGCERRWRDCCGESHAAISESVI